MDLDIWRWALKRSGQHPQQISAQTVQIFSISRLHHYLSFRDIFLPSFFNNSPMIPLNWSGELPNIFQLGVQEPVRHCQINSGSSTSTRKIQKPGEPWPKYFGLSKEMEEHKRTLLVPGLQTLTEIRRRRKDVLAPFVIVQENCQL